MTLLDCAYYALETADLVLMGDQIERLTTAIDLNKKARRAARA